MKDFDEEQAAYSDLTSEVFLKSNDLNASFFDTLIALSPYGRGFHTFRFQLYGFLVAGWILGFPKRHIMLLLDDGQYFRVELAYHLEALHLGGKYGLLGTWIWDERDQGAIFRIERVEDKRIKERTLDIGGILEIE